METSSTKVKVKMSPFHSSLLITVAALYLILLPNGVTVALVEAAPSIKSIDYEKVKYKLTFPRRKSEEAAVVEWGHSAIISALDAVVAQFGPKPSMGASFEVETAPVLADPVDGYTGLHEQDTEEEDEFADGKDYDPSASYLRKTRVLKNADEIHGNMCVMTNSAGMSGVQMAKIAKDSGAAALMIVNVLETENPDYIYSLRCEFDEECEYAERHIDIPVIMVSLSSGNVLTTANLPSDESRTHITNPQLAMPDRVRLYAGGDRPFFEDVSHDEPVVYLIHNLLTVAECDALIQKAQGKVEPVDDSKSNFLEGTMENSYNDPRSKIGKVFGVDRVYLWSGMLKPYDSKAIDERIEQVTGFPQVRSSGRVGTVLCCSKLFSNNVHSYIEFFFLIANPCSNRIMFQTFK